MRQVREFIPQHEVAFHNLFYRTVSRVNSTSTVRSKSHFALRLRYVDTVQACIDARGHHFLQFLKLHTDFPNADLLKVFANKLKRVQACIDVRGHHFLHLL
jgi:hypothetical protein